MLATRDGTGVRDPAKDVPSETDLRASFTSGPQRTIDVGHSKLAYWRFGRGPDVVFVHGWPLTAATFRRVVPLLADAFTCHVIDLPGAGLTETSQDTAITLVAHAATVRAAIDALGLTSYALLAHDSGGFIARLVAADDRARVRGLVLGNTEIPDHNPWLVVMYALIAKLPGGTQLIRTLMRSKTIRASALGFKGCFQDPAYIHGEFHELFVAPLLNSARVAEGQMQLLKTINAGDVKGLAGVHGRIHAPVQLVWGTDDPFFPIARARQMLGQFAGRAQIDEIPGGKLFVHEDRAADFAALARPFLTACFAAN